MKRGLAALLAGPFVVILALGVVPRVVRSPPAPAAVFPRLPRGEAEAEALVRAETKRAPDRALGASVDRALIHGHPDAAPAEASAFEARAAGGGELAIAGARLALPSSGGAVTRSLPPGDASYVLRTAARRVVASVRLVEGRRVSLSSEASREVLLRDEGP